MAEGDFETQPQADGARDDGALTELVQFMYLINQSSFGSRAARAARTMPTQPTPAAVEVEQNPLVLEAELVAAERFATQGDDEAAELARSVLAVPTTEQTWPIQSRAAANLGPDEQLLWLAQPAYTASAPATQPLQEHAEPRSQ
ncbi:MAG: hypothetical protein JWR58_5644 [Pseudonocardia sp.]|jgi:hypothetical protein|nr:hypothetical protein [Pseudonocardia sp.]